MFAYRRDDFLTRYNRHSNVESTFGAVKAKFGPNVRNKSYEARVKEVPAKVLAFDITTLIRVMEETGIEADFTSMVTP